MKAMLLGLAVSVCASPAHALEINGSGSTFVHAVMLSACRESLINNSTLSFG
jgi:hypothetical protein